MTGSNAAPEEFDELIKQIDAEIEQLDAEIDQSNAKIELRMRCFFDDVSELIEHPISPEYLVDGLIEDKTTGALFGESTAGKSFVAVDLSCSVAAGVDWAGREVIRTGLVVYFAGEGRTGIPRRVAAWQAHRQKKIEPGRLYLSRKRVEFDQPGARQIAEEIEALPSPPVLIIVDTLSRSLPAGADENSAKDMMDFLNAVDSIRDRFGCVVCIVHHTGHGSETQTRARGSSAFRAAMDWEILIGKKKSQITWTKMKDGELPAPIGFELVSVAESAAVNFLGSVADDGPKLTKAELLALDILKETFERLGRRWATIEEWRVDFYRRHYADDSDSKRRAFNRSRGDLVNKGLLILDNDVYALSGHAGQNGTKQQMSRGCERDERDTLLRSVPNVPHPDSLPNDSNQDHVEVGI